MKRMIGLFLVPALLFSLSAASRAEFSYDNIPTPMILVVDADDTRQVFYERNADQKAEPASTTKIMTAILALENNKLDDEFMVGQEIEGTAIKFTDLSSLMGLKIGEMVTMRDLVYGLMLVSGNDAGEAIAKRIGGSVDGFVTLMNQKAQALGMTNTHFTNPHGVHHDKHYTTARDLAKLTSYALQNEDFCRIMSTISYTVPANDVRTEELVLINSNRLLRAVESDKLPTVYPYAIGVKTGDTDKAGKCLVAAAEKEGARVICILLKDTIDLYNGDKEMTNLARFINAGSIFDHAFETDYQTVSAAELNLPVGFTTPVENALEEDLQGGVLPVSAQMGSGVIRALPDSIANYRNSSGSITAVVSYTDGTMPKAPITAGQVLGSVSYRLNGKAIYRAALVADVSVREITAIQGMDTPEPTATDDIAIVPTEKPLIGRAIPSSQKILFWVMLLLCCGVIALILVFIANERKRKRREAERRRRAAARRNRY